MFQIHMGYRILFCQFETSFNFKSSRQYQDISWNELNEYEFPTMYSLQKTKGGSPETKNSPTWDSDTLPLEYAKRMSNCDKIKQNPKT